MNLNEQRIREFAYQIWQSEGKPHGHAKRHWEMACKLAASDVQPSASLAAPKVKAASKKQTPTDPTPAAAKPAKKTKAVEPAAAVKTDSAKKTKAKTPEKVETKKPAAAKKTKISDKLAESQLI